MLFSGFILYKLYWMPFRAKQRHPNAVKGTRAQNHSVSSIIHFQFWTLYEVPRAATTMPAIACLNTSEMYCLTSGGFKSVIKELAGLCSSKCSRDRSSSPPPASGGGPVLGVLDLQLYHFCLCLCLHTASSLCVYICVASPLHIRTQSYWIQGPP